MNAIKLRDMVVDTIVFTVSILPGLYLSFGSLQEPWLLFQLSKVLRSIPLGHILNYSTSAASYRSEHLGGELLKVPLVSLSNLPPEWLAVLPLGSILLAIIYFTIAYKVSGSRLVGLSIAIYSGWYYPRLVSQYGNGTYVWTNALFLLFLIIYWEWLSDRKFFYSILMFLVFIITFSFYHTTPVWIIVILVFTILVGHIRGRLGLTANNIRGYSWALPLFCIVFYFVFDTVFYSSFLDKLTTETVYDDLLNSFLSKVLAPITMSSGKNLDPFVVAPINPRIATWSTLISLMILVIPVVYWIVLKSMCAFRGKSLQGFVRTKEDIFIWSIILVALVHALGYTAYGAISIRILPLAFPLIIVIIPGNLGMTTKIGSVLAIILAIISVVGFTSYTTAFQPDYTSSDLGIASNLMKDNSNILSDANIFGLLQLNGAIENKTFDFVWVDSKNYSYLVSESNKPISNVDYIVLDKSHKPIISSGWVSYEPWTLNLDDINKNKNLNKIYDSEKLELFTLISGNIPPTINNQEFTRSSSRTPIVDILRLFTTVVLLFFLSGSSLLFILQSHNYFPSKDTYEFMSYSIILSLCVTIVLGYLVNFSFLGLSALVPMIIILTLINLTYWILRLRRASFPPQEELIRGLLLFMILIIVWAGLSTLIAYSRVNNEQGYTELFVTQNKTTPNLFFVNIINKSNKEENYKVQIRVNDNSTTSLEQFNLKPFEAKNVIYSLQRNQIGSLVNILAFYGNNQSRSLHFIYQDNVEDN